MGKRTITWENDLYSVVLLILLCGISFLWSVADMPFYLRGLITGIFPVVIFTNIKLMNKLTSKYPENCKDNVIIGIFQFILLLIDFWISWKVNAVKGSFYLFSILVFAILFIILPYLINQFEDFISFATPYYGYEIKAYSYKRLFNLKYKFTRIRDFFVEVRKSIVGLYTILFGSLIGLAFDMIKLPIKIKAAPVTLSIKTSAEIFKFSCMVFGLILLTQLLSTHFKSVADQHLKLVEACIRYKTEKEKFFSNIIKEIENEKNIYDDLSKVINNIKLIENVYSEVKGADSFNTNLNELTVLVNKKSDLNSLKKKCRELKKLAKSDDMGEYSSLILSIISSCQFFNE